MSVRRRFLVLLMVLSAATAFSQDSMHTIQRGDTIYSIARSYGVRVDEILRANGISDARLVQLGQRIKIPGAKAPGTNVPTPNVPEALGSAVTQVPPATAGAAGSAPYTEYRVVRGDGFYALSRRFGTTEQAIRAANGLREDYVLKVGDVLKIPQGTGTGNTANPAVPSADGRPTAARSGSSGGGTALGNPTASTVTSSVNGAVSGPASTGNRGGTAGSAAKTTAAASGVLWPVRAKEVMYMTGKLQGVVLLGERSETVKSLTQGKVVSAGPYRGFGKVAIVQMPGGYLYVYGGCESLSVKEGDRVMPGAELGRLGIDGVSSKPQLFFLVYQSNTPIDPAKAPRA